MQLTKICHWQKGQNLQKMYLIVRYSCYRYLSYYVVVTQNCCTISVKCILQTFIDDMVAGTHYTVNPNVGKPAPKKSGGSKSAIAKVKAAAEVVLLSLTFKNIILHNTSSIIGLS